MQLNDFEYWIDANISPSLAKKISAQFSVNAFSFLFMNFNMSTDLFVFEKAKEKQNIIIITKDVDFVNLALLKNPPPFIIWITIGNSNNIELHSKILNIFKKAVEELLHSNKSFIEIQ